MIHEFLTVELKEKLPGDSMEMTAFLRDETGHNNHPWWTFELKPLALYSPIHSQTPGNHLIILV